MVDQMVTMVNVPLVFKVPDYEIPNLKTAIA